MRLLKQPISCQKRNIRTYRYLAVSPGRLVPPHHWVDPIPFLKELRKNPAEAHRVVDYASNHIIELARLMVESGASVITIADPTATGEIWTCDV